MSAYKPKNLEKYAEKYGADVINDKSKLFSVVWKPFELNPGNDKTEKDKRTAYIKKFGEERVNQILPHMTAAGKSCQPPINFSFGGTLANTFDTHRLILLAEKHGLDVQDKVIESMFKQYFEQEQWPGRWNLLEESGVKAGIPRGEVEKLKDDDYLKKEVEEEIQQYRNGVSGVPFFIINGIGLSGAQEPDVFNQVFDEVLLKG